MIAVSLAVIRQALSVFNFFDMSAFMDAGYRIDRGQRIYSDFFFNAGPVHPYLIALFIRIFGFTKWAILGHLTAVNGLVMIATYLVARASLGLVDSLLLTSLSGLSFYGVVFHPYYDQTASLFILLGACLIEWRWPLCSPRQTALVSFCLGILIGLSLMTKSNVALAGGLAFFVVLFLAERRALAIGCYGAGVALAVLIVLLLLPSPGEFIYQTFVAYLPARRLTNWRRILSLGKHSPFVFLSATFLVVISLCNREFLKAERHRVVLFLGLVFTSMFASWTGSLKQEANFPLLGLETFYVVYFAHLGTRMPRRPGILPAGPLRPFLSYAALAVVNLFAFSHMRDNLQWSWVLSGRLSDYELKSAGFRGWRCSATMGGPIDEVVRFIDRNVPPGDSLFVFPDATLIYGLTGRESYRGAPFIFDIRNAPPIGPLRDRFVERFKSSLPRWIVLHWHREAWFCNTADLLEAFAFKDIVNSRYRIVWRSGDFELRQLILMKSRAGRG